VNRSLSMTMVPVILNLMWNLAIALVVWELELQYFYQNLQSGVQFHSLIWQFSGVELNDVHGFARKRMLRNYFRGCDYDGNCLSLLNRLNRRIFDLFCMQRLVIRLIIVSSLLHFCFIHPGLYIYAVVYYVCRYYSSYKGQGWKMHHCIISGYIFQNRFHN